MPLLGSSPTTLFSGTLTTSQTVSRVLTGNVTTTLSTGTLTTSQTLSYAGNNVAPHIASQLPEYLRGNSPLFTGFIETYYKYVEKRENAIGLIQNRQLDTDIDETLDIYVSEFYSTYGEYLPKNTALDKRNFIKLLSDVYDAKGTQKSLKLIFRALFNEDISITYPSEQILKSSDGIWEVEQFITLTTKFGVNPDTGDVIKFNNIYGDFVIDTTKIVQVQPNICRVYFKTYSKIQVVPDQLVYVYNSLSAITYVGGLIKSPSKLSIVIPGTSWQAGQIISIVGRGMNTTARIVGVDVNYGIAYTEILEYGLHEENQIIVLSPYAIKPSSTNIAIDKTLVSISPNVYNHSITISDQTDGIFETVRGNSDAIDDRSYFLTDYLERGYFGTLVIDQVSNVVPISITQNTGITIQEWLNSRATIVYTYDYIVSTKGVFSNERGQLSNQFIRTEDNYFYQPFSYVVETKRDIREYKDILNISHPAGTKRFSLLEKTAVYNMGVVASRALSVDTSYFLDLVNSYDSKYFTTGKVFVETLISSDIINNKVLNKSIADTPFAISLDNTATLRTGYDTGTYFSEKYASHDYTLTIG